MKGPDNNSILEDESEQGVHNENDIQDEGFIRFYGLGKKVFYFLLIVMVISVSVSVLYSRDGFVSPNDNIPKEESGVSHISSLEEKGYMTDV